MELKVVGAGVGRTGTSSLKVALERLLDGPCHHMFEVEGDQRTLWRNVIDAQVSPDWHSLLNGYVAQVDWPGAAFWPELAGAFPDALVVLSVRPSQDWYRSASETIFQAMRLPGDWRAATRRLLAVRFCDDFDNEHAMIAAYERHNDDVRRTIPPERLLEWAPQDGWGPLCQRLSLPEPSGPFPHANNTVQFQERLNLDVRS